MKPALLCWALFGVPALACSAEVETFQNIKGNCLQDLESAVTFQLKVSGIVSPKELEDSYLMGAHSSVQTRWRGLKAREKAVWSAIEAISTVTDYVKRQFSSRDEKVTLIPLSFEIPKPRVVQLRVGSDPGQGVAYETITKVNYVALNSSCSKEIIAVREKIDSLYLSQVSTRDADVIRATKLEIEAALAKLGGGVDQTFVPVNVNGNNIYIKPDGTTVESCRQSIEGRFSFSFILGHLNRNVPVYQENPIKSTQGEARRLEIQRRKNYFKDLEAKIKFPVAVHERAPEVATYKLGELKRVLGLSFGDSIMALPISIRLGPNQLPGDIYAEVTRGSFDSFYVTPAILGVRSLSETAVDVVLLNKECSEVIPSVLESIAKIRESQLKAPGAVLPGGVK